VAKLTLINLSDSSDPFEPEHDPIWFFLKVKLIWTWLNPNLNNLKPVMILDQTTRNPTQSESNDSKTRDDPTSDNLRLNLIWTRTTWNLRWFETRQPETWDDSRLDNGFTRPDPTRAVYMYLIILKLYCINIKLFYKFNLYLTVSLFWGRSG
jgi:hypothetical protein